MDKTIEVLVVAVIAVITSVVVIALLTGQTGTFEDFLGGQSEGAECQLAQTQYENGEITSSEIPEGCDAESWDDSSDDGSDDDSGGSATDGHEGGGSPEYEGPVKD